MILSSKWALPSVIRGAGRMPGTWETSCEGGDGHLDGAEMTGTSTGMAWVVAKKQIKTVARIACIMINGIILKLRHLTSDWIDTWNEFDAFRHTQYPLYSIKPYVNHELVPTQVRFR